jgi:hypothetical protein
MATASIVVYQNKIQLKLQAGIEENPPMRKHRFCCVSNIHNGMMITVTVRVREGFMMQAGNWELLIS